MNKRLPLIDDDDEVRELTAEDMAKFRPAAEVLPSDLHADLLEMNRRAGVRGPQKAPVKERVSIRLSSNVVQTFRASGRGWQTRINAALKDWLKTHSPV